MTTPSIVPTQFQANSTDYLHTKVDRQGVVRLQRTAVSVPSGTTTTTIVGLAPFNAGECFVVDGMNIAIGALGTSVTVDIGVIYDDNTNNTNNQTLFVSASTTAAAGGNIAITGTATNLAYVTTANGWLVATIGGATTGTTGSITAQVVQAYDGLQATN